MNREIKRDTGTEKERKIERDAEIERERERERVNSLGYR